MLAGESEGRMSTPLVQSLAVRTGVDPAWCRGNSIDLQHRISPPNRYDLCLAEELDLWRAIVRAGGIGCVARGEKGRVYDQARPPWIFMPPQSIGIKKVGQRALAGMVAGIDYLVLSFQVPANYDAVIKSLTNVFVASPGGGALIEGSGDLTWRVQINTVWAKDYGVIITSLGDLANPHVLVGGGIRLRANFLVRYWVQVSAAGLANLDPKGRIVCVATGWNYPAE